MASTTHPLRCLLRSAVRPTTTRGIQSVITTAPTSSASFSTTAALQGTKAAAKSKQRPAGVKKPNPGERKAFRKRIQLSNNSAIEVKGLDTLTAETLVDPNSSGKVFALSNQLVDQLRTLEAFKTTQSWGLFRKPHILLRSELADLMTKLKDASDSKAAARLVLRGSRVSGKSLALLQAMNYGLLNGWVVIHIPEGIDLTSGHTEFSPVPDTEPMQFSQPVYTMKLLQNIYTANKAVLDTIKLQKDWSRLSAGLEVGSASASDLIQSCKESEFAWPTFEALWTELTLSGRPPVLFTLDGLSSINELSEYRDPSFNLVHAHDLSLLSSFVDALSGKTKLPNGGAIIAATSESKRKKPTNPSEALVLNQLEAIQAKSDDIPKPDAYEKGYDNRVYDSLKTCEVLRLEGITQSETKALLNYWGASGLFRDKIDSQTVMQKWTIGGHGNVGELERATLMTLRM